MLDDIKTCKIDCVVVKDFSRIGRNYIEVGNYLENIFPFLGVRIVAVNDNFDSKKQSFESSMLMNSLTNIMNEYYARDISKKIIQIKRTMQEKGEFVGGALPYGYKKSDADRKRLVPDPGCAGIVRKIFDWRIGGKGCGQIANYLNELALPSPGLYRYMSGCCAFKRCMNVKWKSKHVASILTNPVYLGHMVQGKTRCSYFEQDGKLRFLPKEDWIIVKDTHKPLVTQEQFDIAAAMAEESRKKHIEQMNIHSEIPHMQNPLSVKIYCGQCGGSMTRRSRVLNNVRDYCYFCNVPKMKMDIGCTNTNTHEVPLMEAVKMVSGQQLRLFTALHSGWSRQEKAGDFMEGSQKILDQRQEIEEKITLLKKKKQELYIGMKEGFLDFNDFCMEREHLSDKRRLYEDKLKHSLDDGKVNKEMAEAPGSCWKEIVGIEDNEIPLWLLDKLIEKIVIFSPKRIEIRYVFMDMVKEALAGQKEGEKTDEWVHSEISSDI